LILFIFAAGGIFRVFKGKSWGIPNQALPDSGN